MRIIIKSLFVIGTSMLLVLASFFLFTQAAYADSVTVNCSGTSGSPTSVDEASLASDDVTFSDAGGDGYCELDASISAASIVIGDGAGGNVVLTHVAEDADGVTITTTGNFTLNSGSSINVDGKGCGASESPNGSNVCANGGAGAGSGEGADGSLAQGAGGASHGGEGGDGETGVSAGNFYGSATAPVLFGSGGGTRSTGIGGPGGGLVLLTIGGNFTFNGTISSDGSNASGGNGDSAGGGGSGGSIQINVTGATSGSGLLQASGGDGDNRANADGGGGGGGRVAFTTSTSTMSFSDSVFTIGGGDGTDGAGQGDNGTVYVKVGDAVSIFYGFTYDADYSVGSWTVDSTALNQYCGSTDTTPSITTTGTMSFAGTFDCGESSVTAFDLTSGGTVSFNSATITFEPETLFTLDDAVAVSLTSSTINSNVQWTGLASLTIDGSSTISADEKGCASSQSPNGSNVCSNNGTSAGSGEGADGSLAQGAGGAGHGGAGGNGETGVSGGSTYGSSTAPILFGSGGGVRTTGTGGTGGGVIRLGATGNITLHGTLSADGGNGVVGNVDSAGGGGSGGSVYITTEATFGGTSGTITATGGGGADASNAEGGGGGGGRVSIVYGVDSSSSLTTTVTGGLGPDAATDGAVGTTNTSDGFGPAIELTATGDTDNDGYIDTIYMILNEDLDLGTVAGSDFTVTGYTVTGATASNTVTVTGGYSGSQVDITITELGSYDTDATPNTSISGSIDDASSNSTTSGSSTPTDTTGPVIVSITPANGDSNVVHTTDIVIVFSEGMDTGSFSYTLSETPTGLSAVWSVSNTTVTLSQTGGYSTGGSVTVEVTGADDTSGNNFSAAIAGVTHPATFSIKSGGSSYVSPSDPATYDTSYLSPEADAAYEYGSYISVTWEYTGTASNAFVDLYYSTDGGDTFTLIEQWVDADNESYRWNTTGVSGQVALRLDVNTLETSQLIVDGETFTLAGDGIDTVVPEEEAVVNPTDNAPDSPSPLTGELEEVTFVEAGSYIRSESFDTVYYITNDFQRRPFYNAQTFFTWHDTFDNVVFTTDATLPLLPLGSPMLPKAETVLVKIQSDARVFALGASDEDEGDLLRWIPSEDVAIELYGDDWSDYVIDLPPTLFPRFGEGQDMDRNEIVDKGALKSV